MSSQAVIQIYGMALATCTQRILVAAIENNAAYKINLVNLMKGEQKLPQHIARQPFGVIPAIEDDGFGLYESRACTRYVNETRGGKLTPTDYKKRALMEQWISLEASTFDANLSAIVVQRVFVPRRGGTPDESIVAAAYAKATPHFTIMNAHLESNQYLAGDAFSLADVFFMPYVNLLMKTPEKSLVESNPNVAAWWKRISERQSWINTLASAEKM